MFPIQTRTAKLVERDDGVGWDLHFDDRVEFYDSANEALQALLAWDDLLVREHGVSVARVLEWTPKTWIGSLVAKTIGNSSKRK